jgi:hypothetical protein
MKKKVLIIVSDNFMFRNYIKTKTFNNIKKKYYCYFLFDKSINFKKSTIKEKKHFIFEYPESEKNKYKNYYLSRIFKKTRKSSTYILFKKIFLSYNKWIDHNNENLIYKFLYAPLRILIFIRDYLRYFYLKLNFFDFLRNYFEMKINLNNNLKNKVLKINPDIIILPTKASDAYYFDLKKISDKYKIKLLYLIDNWDNVSSKSIIFQQQFYGVWGKQSYNQVKCIHDINLKNIFILGSPRFESYFKLTNKKIKSHYKFKYILFLENTYPREIIALKYLDDYINKNVALKNFKIIYRPHPWRKSREIVNIKNYKNVIIDKQIARAYKKKEFSKNFQPNLNYYPSLIKNAEFIIAGPTTMVIESLIFRKKILLLAFKESEHSYSPHNLLKYSEHFKGINTFNNIIINNSLNNLDKDINKIYNIKQSKEKQIDQKRNYFLYRDTKGYKSRLQNIIKKILVYKNV